MTAGVRGIRRGASRKLRLVALALLALGAMPASAQDAQAPVLAQAEKPDPEEHVFVALATAAGVITLDLNKTRAPLTTANFLKYVDSGRLNAAVFYRAMHLGWSDEPSGLLQGGIRDGTKLLPPVAHEPTSQTGILHKAGAISMARFAPGTATADFTILISDMPALDADPAAGNEDARAGFAAFGRVVAGMDVVRAIWDMPRSATAGEGAMKGDMLVEPIRILSAQRTAAPSPADAPAGTGPETP